MYQIYAKARPEKYKKTLFLIAHASLWSFYENDGRFGLHTVTWPMDDPDLGDFICSTKSLETLQASHPELFI